MGTDPLSTQEKSLPAAWELSDPTLSPLSQTDFLPLCLGPHCLGPIALSLPSLFGVPKGVMPVSNSVHTEYPSQPTVPANTDLCPPP